MWSGSSKTHNLGNISSAKLKTYLASEFHRFLTTGCPSVLHGERRTPDSSFGFKAQSLRGQELEFEPCVEGAIGILKTQLRCTMGYCSIIEDTQRSIA